MHIRRLRVDVVAQVVELAAIKVCFRKAVVRQSNLFQVFLCPGRNTRSQDEIMVAEVYQEGFRASRQGQRLAIRCQITFLDWIFASDDGSRLDIADWLLFFAGPARMVMGYCHCYYNIRTQAAVHAVCYLLDVMAARASNLDFWQALVIWGPLQNPRFG